MTMTGDVAPSRTRQRSEFRSAAAHLRSNAGIDHRDAVAAIAPAAEIGAAARRLRASNHWTDAGDPEPRATKPGREAAAPTVVVTGPRPHPAPVQAPPPPMLWVEDEPIVIDLRTPAVIDLDAQVGVRDTASRQDQDWRRSTLAQRAAKLLAELDAAR